MYLTEPEPFPDETNVLLLSIVEQAKSDIINLMNAKTPALKYHWNTACSFAYAPSYTIRWGKYEIKLSDILELVDLDEDWALEKLNGKLKKHLRRRYG